MDRDTVTSRDLGVRVREARVRRGLDVATLAARVGVSARDVERWEAGETVPAMMALIQLAEVLGCTFDDLVR